MQGYAMRQDKSHGPCNRMRRVTMSHTFSENKLCDNQRQYIYANHLLYKNIAIDFRQNKLVVAAEP
jgi:hypothetical protein